MSTTTTTKGDGDKKPKKRTSKKAKTESKNTVKVFDAEKFRKDFLNHALIDVGLQDADEEKDYYEVVGIPSNVMFYCGKKRRKIYPLQTL